MTTAELTQADARATLARLKSDPTFAAKALLGIELTRYQREIAESVRDHPRTAVRSAHGVGKTHTAAVIVVLFLLLHKPSKVITTAPTWHQVESLLWSEIATVIRNAPVPLGVTPRLTSIKLAEDWFAVGLSTNESERFQGYHSPDILVVADEASGVDDPIFDAAEGYFTSGGADGNLARLLLIGNPTRVTGQFARAFGSERALWNTLHISAFDSPACTITPVYDTDGKIADVRPKRDHEIEEVSPATLRALTGDSWVLDKIKMWGYNSPIFDVRVMGNFPSKSENSIVSVAALEDAIARVIEPDITDTRVIGCDVARFGDDETVIAYRYGGKIRLRETYTGQRTTYTAGRIKTLYREITANDAPDASAPRIVIDDTGVGGGVTDILVDDGFDVVAFNAGTSAMEPDEYPNARSEAWFRFADELATLDLDGDDQLIADLTAPVYTIDKHARRVVESKEITKKRIKRSPDRADAVLLTLIPDGFGADLDFF